MVLVNNPNKNTYVGWEKKKEKKLASNYFLLKIKIYSEKKKVRTNQFDH